MNAVVFFSKPDLEEMNTCVEECLTKMGKVMRMISQAKRSSSQEMDERRGGRMNYREEDMEFRYPISSRSRSNDYYESEMDERRGGRSYRN